MQLSVWVIIQSTRTDCGRDGRRLLQFHLKIPNVRNSAICAFTTHRPPTDTQLRAAHVYSISSVNGDVMNIFLLVIIRETLALARRVWHWLLRIIIKTFTHSIQGLAILCQRDRTLRQHITICVACYRVTLFTKLVCVLSVNNCSKLFRTRRAHRALIAQKCTCMFWYTNPWGLRSFATKLSIASLHSQDVTKYILVLE